MNPKQKICGWILLCHSSRWPHWCSPAWHAVPSGPIQALQSGLGLEHPRHFSLSMTICMDKSSSLCSHQYLVRRSEKTNSHHKSKYCKVCFIDNYILLWAETLHRSTVTTNIAVCCSLWFPSFVLCISLSCEIILFPPLSSANCLGLCTILIVKLCQWTKGTTFKWNNTQPIADYLLFSI